jgi:serine phosphatase RsbU (regulator of sigma subunit)/CHASE2 domain-containing sensor protein
MARYLKGWGAPAGLLVLVMLHFMGAIPYQDKLRASSFDLYQLASPRVRISAPVVIVDIDEASLKRFGQWPWPRSLMAKLVSRIGQMQPAAVALDILMPEPDRSSPCQIAQYVPDIDQNLARQLCSLPNNDTLLAHALFSANAVLGVAGMEGIPASSVMAAPMLTIGADPRPFLRHFDLALTNLPELQNAASGHAILSADIENGIVRRVPLVAAVGHTVMPSLSLEMLRLASGSPNFSVKSATDRIEGVGVGDLFIPTQKDGSIWIHYSHHDPERFVSVAEVLDGNVNSETLRRKLVLIGFSGLGLVDFPSTALGERVPGVEIHAQVLESIFDGTTLLRPHWAVWLEGVVMVVLGLAIIWGFPRMHPRVLVPIVVTIIVVLMLAGFIAYHQKHLLLDAASPAFLFVMLFGGMLADSLIREESQRRALQYDLQAQREQAARVQGEMEAARRIQMGIVPDAATTFADEQRLDIAARMEPAKMVGGDLYDFFMLDEHRVFFILGDVCGKGVAASLFMVVSKILCKSVALRGDMNLAQLIRQANLEISSNNPEMLFVTAFAGLLDLRSGALVYCNAGHEKPLLIAPGCHPRELKGAGGPPIGVLDDFEYKIHSYRLAEEEFLCVFSDGITEAYNPLQELFGRERLLLALAEISASVHAENVMQSVCTSVYNFAAGAEASDDLTIMVLRWKGIKN